MSAALSPIPPAGPGGLAAAAGGGAGDDDDDDDPWGGKNFKPLHALYMDPAFPQDEDEEEETKPADAGGEGPHKCHICERTFRSAKSLHGHMRAHPKRKWRGSVPPSMRPGVENEVADSLLLLAGSGEGHQRKYVCDGCKQEFDTRQALGGHRASHRKRKGCYAKKKDTSTKKKKGGSNIAGPVETNQEEQGGGRVGAVEATLAPPEAVGGTSRKAATRQRERKVDLNAPPPISSTSEGTNNNSNTNVDGNGSSTSGDE